MNYGAIKSPKGWKTPKLNNLIRISSRKTVLMDNYVICNKKKKNLFQHKDICFLTEIKKMLS